MNTYSRASVLIVVFLVLASASSYAQFGGLIRWAMQATKQSTLRPIRKQVLKLADQNTFSVLRKGRIVVGVDDAIRGGILKRTSTELGAYELAHPSWSSVEELSEERARKYAVLLQDLGFTNSSRVDADVLRGYQRKFGLEQSGILDDPTNEHMAKRLYQKYLKARGYYEGNVDGDYKGRTVVALMAFQIDSKLTPTGRLNKSTIKKLEEKVADRWWWKFDLSGIDLRDLPRKKTSLEMIRRWEDRRRSLESIRKFNALNRKALEFDSDRLTIIDFQRRYMPEAITGVIGDGLLKKLEEMEQVLRQQARLYELGLTDNRPNGVFSRGEKKVLADFAREFPDGTFEEQTQTWAKTAVKDLRSIGFEGETLQEQAERYSIFQGMKGNRGLTVKLNRLLQKDLQRRQIAFQVKASSGLGAEVLALLHDGDAAHVLFKEGMTCDLWTIRSGALERRRGIDAMEYLSAATSRLVSEHSRDGVLYLHAAPFKGKEMKLQMGTEKITVPKKEWERFLRGDTAVVSVASFIRENWKGEDLLILRDLFSQGRYGATTVRDMVMGSPYQRGYFHTNPLLIERRMQHMTVVPGHIYIASDFTRATDNLTAMPKVIRNADICALHPDATFNVRDLRVIASAKPGLIQRGIEVVSDLMVYEQKNILLVAGHRDEELERFLETSGKAGAFRGKFLVLFTCFRSNTSAFNTRLIRDQYGACGVLFFSEKLRADAVKAVLDELGAEAIDESHGAVYLRDLLKNCVDRAAAKNAANRDLVREIEKMRWGTIQLSGDIGELHCNEAAA